MNFSVAVGLLLVLFMGMVLVAGFAAGDMPNNLKGLNARRDTAPEAFWFHRLVRAICVDRSCIYHRELGQMTLPSPGIR